MKGRVPIAVMLAIVSGCFILYVALFGLYPRYFDISWDEEVRLNDDSIIVVHVKETYERRGRRLSRYADVVRRRTQVTFDAGPGLGHIVFSTRLGIRLLDRVERTWFLVLHGQGPYGNYPDEAVDRWGHDFSVDEDRLAKLKDGHFQPVSWDEAPTGAITRPNFPIGLLPVEKLAEYDQRRITLANKLEIKAAYPAGPNDESISRPIRFGNKWRH